MEIAVALLIGLIAIAFPGRSPVHPGAISLFTRSEIESVDCIDSSGENAATSVLEAPSATRTSNFSLQGSRRCHPPIFSSKERNPFIDKLLVAESMKARQVALQVQAKLKGGPPTPVRIHVEGPMGADVKNKITSIYESELTSILGSNSVLRSASVFAEDKEKNGLRLVVQLHLTDVPAFMSETHFEMVKEGL